MVRGLITGIFWGAIVSALGIVLTSQLIGVREVRVSAPVVGSLELPAGSEFERVREDSNPVRPAPGTPVELSQAPEFEVPTSTGEGPQSELDTAPGAAPETVILEDNGLVAPESSASSAATPGTDAPLRASEAAGALAATNDVLPSTLPQQPRPAAVSGDVTGAPDDMVAPSVDVGDAKVEINVTGDRAPAGASEVLANVLAAADAPQITTSDVLGIPNVETDIVQPAQAVSDQASQLDDIRVAEGDVTVITPDTPRLPGSAQQSLAGPSTRAPGLDAGEERSDGAALVETDRLPQVGDPIEDPASEAPPEDSGGEAAPEADDAAETALARNAEPFENTNDLPIMAMVLMDTGGPVIDMPLPVTIALDSADPEAAERARLYRAAGHEVVLIPALPEGANVSDTAIAIEAGLRAVPQAVAVMADPGGALQTNRDALDQVINRLSQSGHGLITFPKGLNEAQKQAQRSQVPASLIFREVDGGGENLSSVKRLLDQAAFRARQENAVILLGRNRPETLDALTEWAKGGRAASIALAPVSAALIADP